MATEIVPGQRDWRLVRDEDGHRDYKLTYLIRGESTDGPFNVLLTAGLPLPGSVWAVDNDGPDVWAHCQWGATITPKIVNEPNHYWEVEIPFTTRPFKKRCLENQIEDPLLQPPKINGSTSKYSEEATHDRFGRPITNSAFEQIRGQQVEFDRSRGTIVVEQNVPTFELASTLPDSMRDMVNAYPLWGKSRRCIKLSDVEWSKEYYGTCFPYYSRKLTFDTDDLGFDRDILDEGSKVLQGRWDATGAWVIDTIGSAPADSRNPSHYMKAVDRAGNPAKLVLNGAGVPALVVITTGRLFVSMGLGAGNALSDPTKWIPISDNVQVGVLWDEETPYLFGSIVTHDGVIYVAVANNENEEPSPGSLFWDSMPTGLHNAGNYNAATFYTSGDYVRAGTSSGGAGARHVEKYHEADFLLLGVPVVL